jgi:hypothetical protein
MEESLRTRLPSLRAEAGAKWVRQRNSSRHLPAS